MNASLVSIFQSKNEVQVNTLLGENHRNAIHSLCNPMDSKEDSVEIGQRPTWIGVVSQLCPLISRGL